VLQVLPCILTGSIRDKDHTPDQFDPGSIYGSDAEDIEDKELYTKTTVCNDVMLVVVSLISGFV